MFRVKTFSRSYVKSMACEIFRSGPNAGPVEELIILKIVGSVDPTLVQVNNDSHKHSHHIAMKEASNVLESHFRVKIVSDEFKNKGLPERHRIIYRLLTEEFSLMGLHALQLKTMTIEESNKISLKK